jgi:hypothetical protein
LEVSQRPQNNPDLAPLDVIRMFVPLKGAIRRRHFTSDQEVQEAAPARLASQLFLFLSLFLSLFLLIYFS